MDVLNNTVYWAVFVSLGTYYFGKILQEKTHMILFIAIKIINSKRHRI